MIKRLLEILCQRVISKRDKDKMRKEEIIDVQLAADKDLVSDLGLMRTTWVSKVYLELGPPGCTYPRGKLR